MKFFFILPVLFIIATASLCTDFASPKDVKSLNHIQLDSLTIYTGKYQMQQGAQTMYMEVYVKNGKLTGKDLSGGGVKILDHISGDDFILFKEKIAVKFIRDKNHNVTQIAVMGNVMWTKVDNGSAVSSSKQPVTPQDYIGKYQVIVNGQNMVIEISIKNRQLIATQLWDGANSEIDYISGDNFIVAALNIPIKFMRDNNKAVTQLVFNATDIFKKIKVGRR